MSLGDLDRTQHNAGQTRTWKIHPINIALFHDKVQIQIHPPTNKTSFIAFPCLQQELQLTYAVNENKSPDPHIPRSIDFHGLLVSIHA